MQNIMGQRTLYKLRKLTTSKPRGDSWGIGIPADLALMHQDELFNVYKSGTAIILDMNHLQGGR